MSAYEEAQPSDIEVGALSQHLRNCADELADVLDESEDEGSERMAESVLAYLGVPELRRERADLRARVAKLDAPRTVVFASSTFSLDLTAAQNSVRITADRYGGHRVRFGWEDGDATSDLDLLLGAGSLEVLVNAGRKALTADHPDGDDTPPAPEGTP